MIQVLKSMAFKVLGERGREAIIRTAGTGSFYLRKAVGPKINTENLRLHLGCGDISLPGFVNVDASKTFASNVIDDITTLGSFGSDVAAEIYACHVLEHFSHDEVPMILKRWFDVIQPDGTIRISVPDMDKIVKIYNANWQHFQTEGHSPWIGLIYGGQKDRYDYHKTGFNFVWLRKLLSDAGFVDIKEYPLAPHFCGEGIKDASLSDEPFGEKFSLNIMAHKPA